jgi:capsular exopolysaccharide synthesis family protein
MSQLFEALQISENGGRTRVQDVLGPTALLNAAEREVQPDLLEAPTLHVSPSPRSRLISLTEKESLGAEKFRFLGVRLRQMQQARSLKKLLVTSTIPEEGKSVISANLAITLARKQRQRVLLIEGDLRRPVLAHAFGLGSLPGMSELLQQEPGPLKNLYRLEEAKIWFIPAGRPPENPLELMQSGRLSEVLQQLAASFDWVIIDSPPILPLADTTVWSRLSDGVLLISREGTTQKKALLRGLEALGKSNLVGVVINSCSDVDESNYYQRYSPAALANANETAEKLKA